MNSLKTLVTVFLFFASISTFGQKQLAVIKNGRVQAAFKEGEYMRMVLKKNHKHVEGHIIELYDFYMITSNDTIQFKDILKVDIRKHRPPISVTRGPQGALFLGGIIFLAVGQINAWIGVHSADLSEAQFYVPASATVLGAAMIFIRPRYKRINGIQYLQTVDYRSPFYQK